MEDSSKQMLGGAGLVGAGLGADALGAYLLNARTDAEHARQVGAGLYRDSVDALDRAQNTAWRSLHELHAPFPEHYGPDAVARELAGRRTSMWGDIMGVRARADDAARAAEEMARLDKRKGRAIFRGSVGRPLRAIGGTLALSGLYLGGKGLYNRFRKEGMSRALSDLGL